jgi:hypothetical protein
MVGRQENLELLIILRGIATNLAKKFSTELTLFEPVFVRHGEKNDEKRLHLKKTDLIFFKRLSAPSSLTFS